MLAAIISVFLLVLWNPVFNLNSAAAAATEAYDGLEAYIVHAPMRQAGVLMQTFGSSKEWHHSLVKSVLGSMGDKAEDRMLYTYDRALQGFAVRLTAAEAAALLAKDEVPVVMKDTALQLHTTRTPSFLGLRDVGGAGQGSAGDDARYSDGALWKASRQGADVIIGVLDTGVWPEGRRSFADDGLSDVPARWKGTCEVRPTFNGTALCNRKLIGARTFYKGYEATVRKPINETAEYKSPRDSEGHGTHTASTAAGAPVAGVSVFGAALGDASGIAPAARIAVYKVCWLSGCYKADILAALDAAIADGVDILSLSLGGNPVDFYEDSIAIGAYAAAAAGIVVSASAGNNGPGPFTVTNLAPWLLTVAASSLDRDFPVDVILGDDGPMLSGISICSTNVSRLPLVMAADAALPGADAVNASLCMPGLLDGALVRGKIVLCERGISGRAAKGMVVKELGAASMILANDKASGEELIGDCHVLPAVLVGYKAGTLIQQYAASTKSPMASLVSQGTTLHVRPAPKMTAFSSRGPNKLVRDILKPDVTAPGLNILAAWTDANSPSTVPEDDRRTEFNIISGTSMSCPHMTGVAALLRAAHPDWSPAAIKSAVMTSAVTTDNAGMPMLDLSTGGASNAEVHGAGHVHANAAIGPGLIYDMSMQDYFDFLCGLNYTSDQLSVFSMHGDYQCSNSASKSARDLNYPAFSAAFHQNESSSYCHTFSRTLTNVGPADSVTYNVTVEPPPGVQVQVQPASLQFTSTAQKLSYIATFSAESRIFIPEVNETVAFGSLTWTDGYHNVRSPIVFAWINHSF